jgi:ABC-2 type transport system permease protein
MATHRAFGQAEAALAPHTQLQAVEERGWRRGFANLLHKEFSLWWGTRKWLVHMLIWLVLLNGFVLLVALSDAMPPQQAAQEAIQVFFMIGAFATGIGVVTAAQGAIVAEKQLGTAAWLMSKPASRSAFVLTKFVAIAASFLGLAVLLPGVVFYVESLALFGQAPGPLQLLYGLGVTALHVLFYLGLTLLLGTLFSKRGPVTGIAMGFLFGGAILPNFLPQSVSLAFPWNLSRIAVGLVQGGEMPPTWPIPVAATVLWTMLFLVVALWRFGREEF